MSEQAEKAIKFLEQIIDNNCSGPKALFVNAQQALEILKAELNKKVEAKPE